MKPAPIMTPEQHERHHLRFRCATEGERFTVTVAGKINAANAKPIRQRCTEALDTSREIVIDCSAIDEIDKRAAGELLGLRNDAARKGVRVVLRGASFEVVERFVYWHINDKFEFRESSTASEETR